MPCTPCVLPARTERHGAALADTDRGSCAKRLAEFDDQMRRFEDKPRSQGRTEFIPLDRQIFRARRKQVPDGSQRNGGMSCGSPTLMK